MDAAVTGAVYTLRNRSVPVTPCGPSRLRGRRRLTGEHDARQSGPKHPTMGPGSLGTVGAKRESVTDGELIGERFARALGAKDFEAIRGVLADGVQFRALTPEKLWEEKSAAAVIQHVLRRWFDEGDHIEAVLDVETGHVAERRFRTRYRFRVRNEGRTFEVDQQAYYDVSDGRIAWLRVLCSGFMAA